MKVNKKRLCLVSSLTLLTIFIIFASAKIYNSLTDGFNLYNITSEFSFREDINFPQPPDKKLESINHILHQKFTYLGRGAQSYAFVSEDQNYVLKIVKQKHHKFNIFERIFFSLPFTENWKDQKLKKKELRVKNFLHSCKLCYEELFNETYLQYLHLTPTNNLLHKTSITDKLGFLYEIDLDQTEFVLQSKAEGMIAKINSLIEENDFKAAQESVQKIVKLLTKCCKKNIVDNDTAIIKNVGFINGKAIFMDIGQLSKNENIKKLEVYKEYIERRIDLINTWIKTYFPQLKTIQYNEISTEFSEL